MSDWHLSKEIGIGNLLTTIILAIGFFMYIVDIERLAETNAQTLATSEKYWAREVQHVIELQEQQNVNVEKELKRQSDSLSEIKKLLEQLRQEKEDRE